MIIVFFENDSFQRLYFLSLDSLNSWLNSAEQYSEGITRDSQVRKTVNKKIAYDLNLIAFQKY